MLEDYKVASGASNGVPCLAMASSAITAKAERRALINDMPDATITRPIIILGAPRSGTTILRHCLALHPDVWHLPGESHAVLEGPFYPSKSNYESNRVTANDISDFTVRQLLDAFYRLAINLNISVADPARLLSSNSLSERFVAKLLTIRAGRNSIRKKPREIRFLEKTPKNTLRVMMLDRLFPDAYYVLLTRKAAENIDSLIDGWYAADKFGPVTRQRFAQAGYPIARQLGLKDYSGKWWKFALVPGWRDLRGQTVSDVAAWQYLQCNRYALQDLETIAQRRVMHIKHEDFVRAPVEIVRAIYAWADLPRSSIAERFAQALPRVNGTWITAKKRNRALRYSKAVCAALDSLPEMSELQTRLGYH